METITVANSLAYDETPCKQQNYNRDETGEGSEAVDFHFTARNKQEIWKNHGAVSHAR